MKKNLFIAACALLLTACDCLQEVSGTVRDRETQLPIAEVQVKAKSSLRAYMQTDSTGKFGYHGISGGIFGCPKVKLQFSKAGYRTCKRSFSSFQRGEVVKMVPLK